MSGEIKRRSSGLVLKKKENCYFNFYSGEW
jgi:hypothetical protein